MILFKALYPILIEYAEYIDFFVGMNGHVSPRTVTLVAAFNK